jgi:hypothetical protein
LLVAMSRLELFTQIDTHHQILNLPQIHYSFGLFRMGCGRRAFDPAAWSSELQGSLGEEQVTDFSVIFRLAIALALGLIIGMERGWQSWDSPEGLRSVGFRRFGFVGLFGGVSVLRGDLHCIGR